MGQTKTPTEQPGCGPVSQSALPKQTPQGAGDGKEKPKESLLSPPNQAAIQVVSAEPKVKGQMQMPHSGAKLGSAPAFKPVSVRPRCRSHSPRCRIEVDVEEECQGGHRKGMRQVSIQEYLVGHSSWECTSPDPNDDLSKSFPSFPSSTQNRGSLACNSGGFLKVPNNDLQRSLSFQSLLSTSPPSPSYSWGAVHRPVLNMEHPTYLLVPCQVRNLHVPIPQLTPSCSPDRSPFASQTCINFVELES